jgi:malic enzyme
LKEVTVEELLAKAEQPSKDALRLHPYYKGKIEVIPKCRIRDFNDFAIWYTPGVASPCKKIHQDIDQAYEMTNKWNFVAVVSDGSRVLGLGDIGPEAGLPVMEGKALLYKYLGGVDAFPICLIQRNSSMPSSGFNPLLAGSISKTSPTPNVSIFWTHSGEKWKYLFGMMISRERPV